MNKPQKNLVLAMVEEYDNDKDLASWQEEQAVKRELRDRAEGAGKYQRVE